MEPQAGRRLHQTYNNNNNNDNFISRNMTNSSSYAVWNEFFISAGIPNAVANEYAVTFSQHRIRIDMLKEITKDILLDMGIKAMGDIIAILRHAKHVCTQNELKVGQTKLSAEPTANSVTNVINNTTRQPPQNSRSRLHQPIVQNSSSGHSNNDGSTPISGGKIQSRLSLNSGALRAATTNSTSHLHSDSQASTIQKRLSSPTPNPMAKRFRTASGVSESHDIAEKTLTVRYPPKSAIMKAQQRISGNAASGGNNNNGQSTSNIKSRLGGKAGDTTRSGYEIQRGHRGDNPASANNSLNSTQQYRPSQVDSSRGRHDDTGRYNHKHSTVKQQTNRPKSTVFRRLGEGSR